MIERRIVLNRLPGLDIYASTNYSMRYSDV